VILFVYDVELDKCDAKRGFPNRRMNRNKGSDGILNLENRFSRLTDAVIVWYCPLTKCEVGKGLTCRQLYGSLW